jgi:hypothetical protein
MRPLSLRGAVFAFRWIDKVGRRPLALWGYAGMAVFILIAAAGMGFLTGVPKTVLVMVGFFFITAFAIGVGGTGWLIQGEVFPTAVSQSRGRCGRHQTRGVVRRRLMLRSLKDVHKASAVGARLGLGPSPDPGPGAGVELGGGDLGGVGDLVGVGE